MQAKEPRYIEFIDNEKYPRNGADISDTHETFNSCANLQSIAWGILSEGGLQIDIDKSGEAFQRGQIKIRARINSDFALTNPKLISHVRPTV
jgi:hypothetical protein